MPDSLYVDPVVLRELALQHDEVARETLAWAEPPTDYLKRFPEMFGKICDPVHKALCEYYDARYRAGKALAEENTNTANSLRAAAQAFEDTDQDLGAVVRRAAETPGDLASVPSGAVPSGSSSASGFDGPPPVGPQTAAVGGPTAGDASFGTPAVPAVPAATMPPVPPVPGTVLGSDAAGHLAGLSGPVGTPGGSEHLPPVVGPATSASGSSAPTGGQPLGPGIADDRVLTSGAGVVPGSDPVPLIGPTPFGSAVQDAALREAGTGHVVNDDENADLVLARTLLGAVLAATETSAVGVSWAVSVMRGPSGTTVFVTSNEGRGWLPAGLFLPRAISTPWIWGDVLGAAGSPWEGVSDPARILVEFGLVWGPREGAVLSALASSGPVAAHLRADLENDVAIAAGVGPARGVDLRVFTPDTTDRLGIGGSIAALEQIATVPDAGVRSRCVQLALDAHARIGRAVGRAPEAADVRQLRERILARAENGVDVPPQWWQELRAADEMLITTLLPHRLDTDRIGLGELRADEQSTGLRLLTFERRCNELVLLLEGDANRQCLRDAVYAHEQIVAHPQFAETAPAASITDYASRAGVSGVVAAAQPAGSPPPAPGRRAAGESAPS
ncbi:type VII secretion target [Nocardia brasiliensis]|uniref:type VII secretion target n=1 Tax=Nocardia brasiliensis TaxID=37326 RepID=UPI003D92BAB3